MLKEISLYITGYDLAKDTSWLWPNAWWYWRLFIPYQNRFRVASQLHDSLYDKWTTEIDKGWADFEFYYACLHVCSTPIQRGVACLYYELVKAYWHYFFNYQ